ncbi:MAG TPA: S41 family peptidase [Vicinamibacterales bacterium]|nr:S41 family peptidase [Vicinamibacterales bacterium]
MTRRASVVAAALLSLAAAPLEPVWLESFDAAWRIINETYYDPSFNGVDWEAVRRELRPRAEVAETPEETRAIIREMITRLRDSHFTLLPEGRTPTDPPSRDTSGDPGLDIRYQDGVVLVVDLTAEAQAAGVRRGWILRGVDGEPLAPAIAGTIGGLSPRLAAVEAWRIVTDRVRGPVGSRVHLSFADANGSSREVRVEREVETGEPVKLGTFPMLRVRTAERALTASSGARLGYIRFNAWLTPVDAFVARAVDRHRDDAGIVLDLRGNPGGLAAMLMGIAGHFTAERVSLGEMRTREGTLKFFSNPRSVAPDGRPVKPYAGCVAILVDQLTGSASECFAGGMQAIGRARVFGQRTMGQALPALFDRLPSGDVLVHAYGDFVTAAGNRVEGSGVVPDEEAAWSRSALLEGRDVALERAVAWCTK